MRLATFNLESLDRSPKAPDALARRTEILRPQLERLDADVLCLQEVNAQHVPGRRERTLAALDQLLAATPYAGFERAVSHRTDGAGAADVHNLVVLSRFPIRGHRQIANDIVPPLAWRPGTARPPLSAPQPVSFDRPALIVDIALGGGLVVTVVNVHLRAPIAAAIAGQKLSGHAWATTAGWAEGYFLAGLKRNAQALEVRLAVDAMLDADPHRLIAIAGDCNAEDGDVAMKLLLAAEEETGNGDLAARALVPAERGIAADRRFSIIHHGRPQMLDHILLTRTLLARLTSVEVHNEALADELLAPAAGLRPAGSSHAPLVAEFNLPPPG